VEYIRGAENTLADMLSRPWDKTKKKYDKKITDELAGSFYHPEGDDRLYVYIPSWCRGADSFEKKVLLEKAEMAADCFTLKSHSTGVWCDNVPMLEFRIIEQAQHEDKLVSTVKNLVDKKVDLEKAKIPDDVYGIKRFARIWKKLEIHAESGCLTVNWGEKRSIVLPKSLLPSYLKMAHEKAHGGVHRTREQLAWSWWPDQFDNIREFVASCSTCLKFKGHDMQKGKPDRQVLYRAQEPMQILYIDFIKLPRSKTVYPTARSRAKDAARALMNHILLYDFPKIISSDQGKHFRNELVEELCALLGIKQNLHVAWRPQSTGCLERQHRVLKSSLYGMALERDTCWELILPAVVSIGTDATQAKMSSYNSKIFFR
jgi:hypothetical protein